MKKVDIEPVIIGNEEYVAVQGYVRGSVCTKCTAFNSAFLCSRLESVIPGMCGLYKQYYWLSLPQFVAARIQGKVDG